ncbi:ACP S-malonyltransferase [Harryflintia acetispora]|uniref:Malonyl CoA-acyl carrier protein transacylase n=1 Tax=Harryflintia acetispora TaxID=1849041 RepID=A0A9X8UK63_9FIRM|nr:ACP S-malonyltransferase [Harryflintia acetispora]TCL43965.1 [acyl-carrier-protein] S-malonyltransferase [Harryflintia acetispora]
MENLSVLFCGQGSQAPGMGKELCDNFASAREIFECGSDILGFDLQKTCFEGDEAALAPTAVAQPAIFAVSLAGYRVLERELGLAPFCVGGHSLGEYGALSAAGVWSMEDGFRVIKARAAAMERAAQSAGGVMFAIIGLDESTVERVCEETEGYVLPVNYNSPIQTVIAGENGPAEAAVQKFQELGAKAVKLGVASAFHTKLMQSAADEFCEAVRGIPYNRPALPFYSNRDGECMEDFGDLYGYLHAHMLSPVLFTRELMAMQRDGAALFVEVGPGKVVSGLVKRTLKGTKPISLENLSGVEKLKALLN